MLLAAYLIQLAWVKLRRRRLPLYLAFHHFLQRGGADDRGARRRRRQPWLGLSAFWATVVKVELTDIVFAIDSILVAVAMSPKLWVILTGGILGIVDDAAGDRPAAGDRRALSAAGRRRVRHHRLGRHQAADRVSCTPSGYIAFEVPKWLSLGLIVVIFGGRLLYARRAGAAAARGTDDDAKRLLNRRGRPLNLPRPRANPGLDRAGARRSR